MWKAFVCARTVFQNQETDLLTRYSAARVMTAGVRRNVLVGYTMISKMRKMTRTTDSE